MVETISVRLSKDIRTDLQQFLKDERLEQISEATRKVIALGLEEWRKEKALRLLEQGKVSFAKAAQIAKLSVWDFWGFVQERKIVWVKPELKEIEKEIEDALA